MLEHAARWNLKTVMTFHQRVEEAAAFAEKLPETAAELYATDASEQALSEAGRLPESSIDAEFYELEAGRHVPPDRVWSTWLCGDHLVAERREAIRQFANGLDASGRRAHRAFLASVRVLGQGVDIVGTRGVEAVCFADTRGSQVEIVQNIGRALRPNPDGSTKVARIIVPVFLEPGENPEDMVASASFRPLVAVLQGLRSHSEQLVEQLASHALTRSHQQRRVHIHRDAQGRIVRVGGQGEGGGEGLEDGEGADGTAESALLYFSSPRDPATIAAFLRTRVYRPESLVWLEGYQARRRWREENGITGLHPTPHDTETSTDGGRFPVGRWEAQQRRAARTGDLDAWRRELLDEDGMVWEPGEEAWETKLALFRSYHRAHGHLAPRQDAPWGETDTDTQPIGQQVANIRRKNGLGKNPERAETRAAQLTAIDPDWNCPWPLAPGLATPLPHPRPARRGRTRRPPARHRTRRTVRRRRPGKMAPTASEQLDEPVQRTAAEADRTGHDARGTARPRSQQRQEDGGESVSGLPARRSGPRTVHRPRRTPPHPQKPHRGDHSQPPQHPGIGPARGVHEQHQIQTGQAHHGATRRAGRTGRGMGLSRGSSDEEQSA